MAGSPLQDFRRPSHLIEPPPANTTVDWKRLVGNSGKENQLIPAQNFVTELGQGLCSVRGVLQAIGLVNPWNQVERVINLAVVIFIRTFILQNP